MENSLAMRVFDRARDFGHELYTLPGLGTQSWSNLLQTAPRREFHAEKWEAVLALAHLVDRKNVRMIKAGCRVGFAPETLEHLMCIRVIIQNAFYGDDPLRVSLAREINYAHAAATDLVENFVIAQAPLLIRHVHLGDCTFKNCSRHLVPSFQSLPQEATDTNSSMESLSGATLLAFRRALVHTRDRVREPVRSFHLDLLSSGGERRTQVPDLVLNVCGISDGVRDFIAQ